MASNFDGAVHYAGSDTENQQVYAARQPAIADGLAGLLNEAYCYAREHSQLFAARAHETTIASDTPEFILRVSGAWLPPHATAIVCAIRHRVTYDDFGATGHHFLRILGSISDLDSTTVTGPSSESGRGSGELDTIVYLPIDDDMLTALGADREDLFIELYGHALTGSAPAQYLPLTQVFFWLSER